jgi:hypothetical protein
MDLTRETPSEGYGYSIDSWPKKLQEEFWDQRKHREESEPPVRAEGTLHYKPGEHSPDATVFHFVACGPAVSRSRMPRWAPRCCCCWPHGEPVGPQRQENVLG